VKSRTLFSVANEQDRQITDASSSCGYHKALLNWLTGGFARPSSHQQSVVARVDMPHMDVDNGTEIDIRLSSDKVQDKSDDRLMDVAFKPQHNETWPTTSELVTGSQSGVVPVSLNVAYAATAEIISSVPE